MPEQDEINLLAFWRVERGLTMRELAEKSGVEASTISRIENGDVKPYLSTLSKLAKALNIELKVLSSLSKNPKESREIMLNMLSAIG